MENLFFCPLQFYISLDLIAFKLLKWSWNWEMEKCSNKTKCVGYIQSDVAYLGSTDVNKKIITQS